MRPGDMVEIYETRPQGAKRRVGILIEEGMHEPDDEERMPWWYWKVLVSGVIDEIHESKLQVVE